VIGNLTDLKVFCEIVGTTYDSLLNMLLAQKSASLESACNRRFELHSRCDLITVKRNVSQIHLGDYPVVSVAAITIGDITTINPSEYYVSKAQGTIYFSDGVILAGTTVCVTYSAGYTPSTYIPQDIVFAVYSWVNSHFVTRKLLGIRRERVGDRSIELDTLGSTTDLPSYVREVVYNRKRTLTRYHDILEITGA